MTRVFSLTRAFVFGLTVSMAHLSLPSFALAGENDPAACTILAKTSSAQVETCSTGISAQRWMKLSVKTRNNRTSEQTTINAIFSGESELWNRVWVSDGNGRIPRPVQLSIQKWIANPSASLAASGFLPLLDVLGNFLNPDTRIEDFDRIATLNADRKSGRLFDSNWDGNWMGTWTPICEAIGTKRIATFVLKGDAARIPQLIELPVGERATECRGRCGWGCAQAGLQIRHNQYTQECFNHDACNWTFHQQLGVCSEAFWAAAASYVFAPNCPNSPTFRPL